MKYALAFPIVLFFAQVAQAQPPAESRLKFVAPFLDEQTIVVIRIDVRRLDASKLPAIVKLISERAAIEGFVKQFKDAGISEVFVVVALHEVPFQAPFVVVPQAGDMAVAELLRAFKMDEIAKIGSAYVAGSKATLKRLRNLQPAELPDMKKAFDALPAAAVQAVGVLPDTLRRSLEESVPKLPWGDVPVKSLTRGLRWVSLWIDFTPQEMLGLTVQARSEEDAKAIDKAIAAALRALPRKDGKLAPEIALVEKLRPQLEGDRLALKMSEKDLNEFLAPVAQKMLEGGQRTQKINNLKQIALAMHIYHDMYKSFPAAASYDKQGRPLLSWRVHLLPFLDQNELYKQFRLDEPWDSEHNRKLIERMPAVYRSDPAKAKDKRTAYLTPLGKQTVFPPGKKGINLAKDIPDGTSNTILIVEADADHAVVWTRPQDLEVDLQKPLTGLIDKSRDYFLVAFADGSVRVISRAVAAATLRALFTRNGGEPVQDF